MLERMQFALFFFSSRRRHTRCLSDWSSDVCSSDLWTCRRSESRRARRPQQLQLEAKPAFFAVLPLFGEARSPPRVGQKTRVAASAAPTARRQPAVAMA